MTVCRPRARLMHLRTLLILLLFSLGLFQFTFGLSLLHSARYIVIPEVFISISVGQLVQVGPLMAGHRVSFLSLTVVLKYVYLAIAAGMFLWFAWDPSVSR